MPGSSTGQPLARDMAVSVLTSLLTLPTELLQEIIQYLDNLSLIEFALTCKGVHCIALEHFFSREKVLIPSPDDNWCSTPLNSPVESLRLEDVRKTLGARLTRETRTGTKSDSERCYIVQTKAERAKEKDDVQERRCRLMRATLNVT